jgi:hypothetical protein
MNDKLAVNFVAVAKPKDRNPILSRRSKLISYLDRQLANVHNFKSGSQTRGAQCQSALKFGSDATSMTVCRS